MKYGILMSCIWEYYPVYLGNKDARRRLRKVTGIDNWTAHDLRRTCRTIMAYEGVPPHIAEQVLGYVQSGIEDLGYDHLKAHWKEVGGIPEQAGLELMANARQAVEAFSTFMEEFNEKAGFDYCPPKGGNSRNQTD